MAVYVVAAFVAGILYIFLESPKAAWDHLNQLGPLMSRISVVLHKRFSIFSFGHPHRYRKVMRFHMLNLSFPHKLDKFRASLHDSAVV